MKQASVVIQTTKHLRIRLPKEFDYDFADFTNVDLRDADLRNCSLRFATLIGTDLKNAIIENTCFEQAIFDSKTRLPFSLGEAFMRGMILKITTEKGSELFYKRDAHGPYVEDRNPRLYDI